MEKYRLDRDWKFFEGDIEAEARTHTECYMAAKAGGAMGGGNPDIDISGFESVDLPHDFAVGHSFDEKYGPSRGYKARGKGWYFKRFRLEKEDAEKELYIEFGGVATHCVVYLNGSVVYRNFCGYNSFIVNITDMAVCGEGINTLAVYVNADVSEGWWYEGAGIYRHVDLYKSDKLHIKPRGVFVKPQKKSADVWDAETFCDIVNYSEKKRTFTLVCRITDATGNITGKDSVVAVLEPGEEMCAVLDVLTYSPYLWDIDSPHRYLMISEIFEDDICVDRTVEKFGFRTVETDKDKGFFLNGRHVKLYGTCNHQDHAGVGAAVPDSINEYRIRLLKEMGTNAYRCAHGNPSPEILDLCDKYGLLVMDENRNFNTSPNGLSDIRDMVLRDRNHPSVVMYSLFNEEPLQGTPTGKKLAERMRREAEKYDDTRFITGAMNGGVLSDAGASEVLDITGFNYITAQYDSFREKFPERPMLGSENNSAFETRFVYKTDNEKHIIDSYDSYAAPWGNTHRDGFRQVDTREYVMGMFIWTGFDYRGEPTPYEYPSVSTQFGIMDTCGFKKDAFYLNKAYFTSEPMIHIVPSHWNFKSGEKIKVMSHTNCDEAELIINGKSLGKKTADKYDMCEWIVDYEPGELVMKGYRDGVEKCSDRTVTSSEPKKLSVSASRGFLYADCGDAAAVNVCALDKDENMCFTADDTVRFSVSGGKVIGVGNGDPNSHESDKADFRRLFNGLCQAIVIPDEKAEKTVVTVTAEGLEKAVLELDIKPSPVERKYIESVRETYISTWRKSAGLFEKMPNVSAKLADNDMNSFETVTVGNGTDEMFDGKEGYGVYKTSVKIPEKASDIVFREIKGDMVYIYTNGELAEKIECRYGRKITIPAKNQGMTDIDVCIFSEKNHKAGISGSVVIEI